MLGKITGYILTLVIISSCALSSNSENKIDQPVDVVENNDSESKSSVKMETYTTGAKAPVANTVEKGSNPEGLSINWMDFESAIDANQNEKKYILIYTYTDWCSWCKKMKATTFQDQEIINLINENFHPVLLNPEIKQDIAYNEVLYEMKAYGKKSYNELAVNLLGGKMSFPSIVILSKREVKKETINGYQSISVLKQMLKNYSK